MGSIWGTCGTAVECANHVTTTTAAALYLGHGRLEETGWSGCRWRNGWCLEIGGRREDVLVMMEMLMLVHLRMQRERHWRQAEWKQAAVLQEPSIQLLVDSRQHVLV